jgi:hypothetical protein
VPLVLIGQTVMVACGHAALHAAMGRERVRSSPPSSRVARVAVFLSSGFSWSRYVGGCVSVLLFCYTAVSLACFRFLTCVRVGSRSVVFAQPTIDCSSATYRSYLALVAIAIALFVVGMPATVMAFLTTRRRAIQAHGVMHSAVQDCGPSLDPAFLARWGPLFSMYRPSAWGWQVCVLLRRAVFVLLSATLVDRWEAVSLTTLVLLSTLLTASPPPYDNPTAVVLFILIVPLTFSIGAAMLRDKMIQLHATVKGQDDTQAQADAHARDAGERETQSAETQPHEVELIAIEPPVHADLAEPLPTQQLHSDSELL